MHGQVVRVATWNVKGLKGDATAVVEVLRTLDADVVAVQEPPRGPGARRRLRDVAARSGLAVLVQGGGARTTALLARPSVPALGSHAVRLPWTPGRTRRGLSVADLAGMRVVSVHLGLDPAERDRHLTRLLPLLQAAPGALVLAGDLNEPPGGPSWVRLGRHLRDLAPSSGPTFSARRPRTRIDVVLGSGLAPVSARTLRGASVAAASDHCPVVVEVRGPWGPS